ncbi:hypothetical protein M378DRAFT_178534 [Amanita muscaria Koide BX008]|uniref:Uncharacterized protein n=1 Tax=Amanita muscaria (strain Koide BX008) TaxID=946122 RepID=A0A0C2X845_AMAMK|nr:hypothetical protein M378DRAFT_178534 [Amanita muscaria Koide BX008]
MTSILRHSLGCRLLYRYATSDSILMSSSSSSQTAFPPPNETDYPEQKHAGRVGLGPNYSTDADMSDKLKGLYEEAKGKLLHEPELVERGHARRIGEVKEKEKGKQKEGNDVS